MSNYIPQEQPDVEFKVSWARGATLQLLDVLRVDSDWHDLDDHVIVTQLERKADGIVVRGDWWKRVVPAGGWRSGTIPPKPPYIVGSDPC